MSALQQLYNRLSKKELSSYELTEVYLDRITEENPSLGAYLTLCPEKALSQAKEVDFRRAKGETLHPLAGIPMAVKDNFCTAGIPTTCASRMLRDFLPPYTATCVRRLEEAGGVMLGKLNLDEFAMGATGEYSAYYPALNPHDLDRMAGGSSSGSAASVAADLAVYSLGSDTGGSVRLPASFCGVVGMKPTYGRISRFGMIAFASSLDTVGIVTSSVYDSAMVLSVMAGADPLDATCSTLPVPDYFHGISAPLAGLRIGVPEEFFTEDLSTEVQKALQTVLDVYRSLGAVLVPLSLPVVEDSLAVYHILSSAEGASNLSRYDGVRFGARAAGETSAEIARNTKEQFFGGEVKARMESGAAYLEEANMALYYRPAQAKQQFIKDSFRDAFQKVDLVFAPTATCVAPASHGFTRGEKRAFDRFTVPASLAGLPSVSIPCKTEDTLPIGFQLVAPHFREDLIFRAGHLYEKEVASHA